MPTNMCDYCEYPCSVHQDEFGNVLSDCCDEHVTDAAEWIEEDTNPTPPRR
jgi:hypothetical protein